jgi:hypothetical protein
MICTDCHREIEVGDRYIKGTVSEHLGRDVEPEIGDLLVEILGTGDGEQLVYCMDCTVPGGDLLPETYYGDEA